MGVNGQLGNSMQRWASGTKTRTYDKEACALHEYLRTFLPGLRTGDRKQEGTADPPSHGAR
jgi:hypothetical protein